ncbi:eukaryotic translation initiation factor 3 subunit d [Trypanosoma cruzi]|uniref:Eukaryotic translation initiation factor 3 subunit 7-like protein, putative n=2 Tax=Trypanosoma cruzi TaxID=5693 RepID=Q4DCN0_TRYCC|nr:eukaryotic translation initiation factor 3 subunit 7-like protein, putative [Trypanosoma cruzi]7ASE_A Chain A, Eukaryotic translation initiation factor 3 subunit 7-like protein, putative [Trypanosoma cruzi]EAN90294.1 eukaryotic translation initiation factor 3 subunit 7-like protein, putative [Trypanosoma cruzi]KAF5226519.1 eukaryotic translation initiation factor 3 subunit d [Trypanosoma cruzi]KAF8295018.1 eukaryotic translation initiation factor 3 subunit d [Trypanosoma cruzi]PWV15582.1 eu|eukprot:XP_812145.1 eukaryotic translation initiation factor 3 subunit 7-like protein [Trypanosoma cruzi strain CL
MGFELPEIFVNAPFTWGPPPSEIEMDGMKVRLYQKTDAIAPSDWLEAMLDQANETKQFTTVKDENRLKALRNLHAKERRHGPERRFVKHYQNARSHFANKAKRNLTLLPDTVKVPTDVLIFAEFTQAELAKMQNLQDAPTVTDISLHNRPLVYNNAMEKASCKTPIRLEETNKSEEFFARSTTVEDGTLRDILKKEAAGTHPIVVTTDEVLALMMTCSRGLHPWHLEIFRYNRMVFISKTEKSNVEVQWVGETADTLRRPVENDPNESERITNLAKESTKAFNAFVAQACLKTRYQMKCEKNPFPDTQPRLYRYRRFVMHAETDDHYDIIVRCEIDAVQNDKYVRIFGLLEQCADGVESEWRKTLDSQGAKWISDEYRRNAQKMSRWVCLCHLSGTLMKIGFLSRSYRSNGTLDPNKHEVLATHTKDPGPLAAQLGIKVGNMWAIADAIIMAFLKQQDLSEALLVKKSGGQSIMLIEKMEDEEEEDDDDDDDDDGGSSDGDV